MRLIIIFIFFISSLNITGQEFHTVLKYENSFNKGITIKNSFPKGGLTYTAPNGEEYIYVIFWTSIINHGNSDLELSIDFPTKPFTVPSSPNVKFNLYVPNEEMTFKKVSLFNYGLDLESYLNKNLGRQSKYVKTISPNQSHQFYVIALSNQRVNGVVRAGFELENQDLKYKINGYEMSCGKLTTQND